MKSTTKKNLAKETLLFTVSIAISIIFYLSTFLWNAYFNYKTDKTNNEIEIRISETNKLPTDKIKKLYDVLYDNFLITNYQMDGDSFMIPKHEEEFWNKRTTSTKLNPYPEGYSILKDSTYAFDFVIFSEFRAHLKNDQYRTLLKKELVHRKENNREYGEEGQALNILENIHLDGLSYSISNSIKREALVSQIQKSISKSEEINSLKIDSAKRIKFTVALWLSILILLYPCRFLYRLIKWSIDTYKIKQ